MYETLGLLLDRYRVLLAPTLAVPARPREAKNDDPDFTINGKPVHAYLGWEMTYPYNLLHQLPAMSVPGGFAASGVPANRPAHRRPDLRRRDRLPGGRRLRSGAAVGGRHDPDLQP